MISNHGHLLLKSPHPESPPLNLYHLIQQVSPHAPMPIILRFTHLIKDSLQRLYTAFESAIQAANYQNGYVGVYPLKVNHQHQVVEAICRYGETYGHGFEVGTKAELNIALAYAHQGSLIIVNGYKDPTLIRLALRATQLGMVPILVIESLYEVPLIIAISKELGIKPRLGIRVKLATKPSGHWQQTGGIRSVFGLTALQIQSVYTQLKEAHLLDCLELVHFHFGSQLPMLSDIITAVTEACHFYVALVQQGVPLRMMDIGGGLAVDYMGHQTSHSMSKNYTLTEFTTSMLGTITAIMNRYTIPHPLLISEFGRATVAASSALIFNVLDVNQQQVATTLNPMTDNPHPLVNTLWQLANEPNPMSDSTRYQEALSLRDQVYQLFRQGDATLADRTMAETAVLSIVNQLKQDGVPLNDALQREMADVYYGNFSIFQSLPDVWAIDQLFPVIPIQQLHESPTINAIVSDITCDCDGKMDQFIGQSGIRSTLPLHPISSDTPYYLGVFLIGAYQETLGDLHNLFGDPHVVSIDMDHPNDRPHITHGDTVRDVIQYCRYDSQDLFNRFNQRLRQAIDHQQLSKQSAQHLMQLYAHTFVDYTYNRPYKPIASG